MLGEKNKQMSYTGISVLPSRRKIMKKEGSGKFLFVFFFEMACIFWLGISAFLLGRSCLG
jgi:hypothetical protein